ncbi:MAG: hypothetical protein HQ559_04255 [Lentisphaerae bacterium]|nr:hypothetical protein [Lentisphaerota bacterium]
MSDSPRHDDIPVVSGRVEVEDGREVVHVGGLTIPVIGYVNCTGHPLPGDAENARRIQEFLDAQDSVDRRGNVQ